MTQRICRLGLALTLIVTAAQPVRAEITAEMVNTAIRRGNEYLIGQQDKTRGGWSEHLGQPGGLSALCTLALLTSGVDVKDPAIQRALNYQRSLGKPEMTYSTALQTMVFCIAEPDKDRHLVVRNVRWLEAMQLNSGGRAGMWGYGVERGNGDNSNTQFALLALHEAERIGVKVGEQTWRLTLNHWLDTMKADGSWGYVAEDSATGSMTCAGIASLIIAMEKLPEYAGDAQVVGDTVNCCGNQANDEKLRRAIQWLGEKFAIHYNPSAAAARGGAVGRANLLYYLYAVERAGRLSGRRFFGRHDWYREGAEKLVGEQDALTGSWKGTGPIERNELIATSLALLFLAKGRRPVVLAKYKHSDDGDWDLHRHGVQNLVRSVERNWRRDLTWQTIEARAATVDDLLESPVLFMSGRESLKLSREQKDNLREYINQGGFIFAEDCCEGAGFDRDFRLLMKDLFPDSELRLLPPDHPVWYAEKKVDPKYARPLLGIDACCRTSVVYCPQNLSCYWELSRGEHNDAYSKPVQDEIAACLATGGNVLAYATNREVQEKLGRPHVIASDNLAPRTRDLLYIPKLSHDGGSDDAPNAWSNLLRVAAQQIDIRLSTEKRLLAPDDPKLLDYPIVFLHGRRSFRFTAAQRTALQTYLQRGGFIFADAICASPQFAESFRNEMKAIFPDNPLAPISADHPMLTQEYRGYDIRSVQVRNRTGATAAGDPLTSKFIRIPAQLEGLEINGRLAVVFSPIDISCAMENTTSLDCQSYDKPDAARIGINVILYALQQ